MSRSKWLDDISPVRRRLFLLSGHICAALGIIAIILPVIPTSPFLILAAACYARSSEKFYNMLIENKYFGAEILRWEKERCMRKEVKVYAMLLIAVVFSISTFLFLQSGIARGIMLGAGLAVLIFLYSIPVCRHDNS